MTTQIPMLGMTGLRNDAFIDVAFSFGKRLKQFAQSLTAAPVAKAVTAYNAAQHKLEEEYKTALASALTNPIKEADNKRDHAYGLISNIRNAYLAGAGSEAQTKAATDLDILLKTYKVTTDSQYNIESGAIAQLCDAIEKSDIDLAVLSLTDAFATLKEQNDIVRNLLLSRNEERAFTVTEVVERNRKAVTEAMADVVSGINALAYLQPSEAITNLVAFVTEDFNYIRTQLLGTKRKSTSTTGNENNGTTEGNGTQTEGTDSGTTDNGQQGTGSGGSQPSGGDGSGTRE